MWRLSGCFLLKSFSKAYISSSKIFVSYFSTHNIVSNSQPFALISFSSRRKRVFSSPTKLFLLAQPGHLEQKIFFLFAECEVSNILQPTQPARRAVGESGFRFSIISGTKKVFWNDKKIQNLKTFQVIVEQEKFGLLLLCNRSIIVRYAPSKIFAPTLARLLLTRILLCNLSNKICDWLIVRVTYQYPSARNSDKKIALSTHASVKTRTFCDWLV